MNVGGMGGYLTQWLRGEGHIADFIVYKDGTMRQNHDWNLRIPEYRYLLWFPMQCLFFFLSLFRYDLFHFYYGRSLLPYNLDLPFLRLFGKKILMHYCGSDVRLNYVERARNPYWDRSESSNHNLKPDWQKQVQLHWHRLWVHKAIAGRSQYEYVRTIFPEDRIISKPWLYQFVDPELYIPAYTTKDRPLVVHAPSNRSVKGTSYVEAAVQALKDEGYEFDFRMIEKIPNDEAQRIYREEADIIVDQFLIGDFGSLAIEGMYAGKPVMAYVHDSIIQTQCPDCPIVNATIDTLKDRLARLIENPEERIRLGRLGRAFTEKYCDRTTLYKQLLEIYESL